MQDLEYRRLSKVENSHWWYRSVHALVMNEIKGRRLKILDAGCGTGGLTSKLTELGKVTGIDVSPLALSLAEKNSVNYVNGSVNKLPFRQAGFDLITSISVLYHKRVNDRAALKEICRTMKKNGQLILILPAFGCLFSEHDIAVHTERRYTLGQVKRLVEEAELNYIKGRYIFSFLFPIFIMKRMIEKLCIMRCTVSDLEELPKLINSLLIFLCRIEWAITRYIKLPFGSSLIVVARK